MSIDYQLFTFACVPYSGEDWFVRAAQCAGLGYRSMYQSHPLFHTRKSLEEFRVSMVRHPCDWLAQVYQAREALNGYTGGFGLLNADSFPSFVRQYLDRIPGELIRLWKRYESDSCQRYEDQPWALAELLETLNVPRHFIELARQVPKLGCSRPTWDKSLRRMVLEAEEDYCAHFDYY